MIIGILSDTHGRVDAAREAVKILRARDATFFIHCGDVGDGVLDCLPSDMSAFVFGNNDWDTTGLKREAELQSIRCLGHTGDLELAGKRIRVTHGDNQRAIDSVLKTATVDYLFTGHTHMPRDRREGSIRWINPGALFRAATKSVATLDLSTDLLTFHEVSRI